MKHFQTRKLQARYALENFIFRNQQELNVQPSNTSIHDIPFSLFLHSDTSQHLDWLKLWNLAFLQSMTVLPSMYSSSFIPSSFSREWHLLLLLGYVPGFDPPWFSLQDIGEDFIKSTSWQSSTTNLWTRDASSRSKGRLRLLLKSNQAWGWLPIGELNYGNSKKGLW